jgi:hypothetical protein
LVSASAQTQVDLRTQGKNVDFSGVPTKPFQTGTVLPTTCSVGATFFKADAAAGQNFYGCTATNVWTVEASGAGTAAGSAANYSAAFTSQTSIVIPGTAHGYTTSNLLVQCYDTGSSIIIPSSVSIDSATYDVTIGFLSAHSGRCLVNGGGSGGSGGSGASSVASVFGRTGAILAQTGDYNSSQITGTVSGDVSGNLSALVVTGIQGQPVAATPATNGQVLAWNAALAQWGPSTVSSGSGSGVISTLGVALSNSTALTIGAGCSAAAPCNVRFGSTVWSIQRPATATVASGTGTAFIYVDQTGTVTVGHNLSVTCSAGCQAQTGITSFPINTIPIATWTATNGTWDAQGSDWRAWLSTKVLSAGQGIMVIDTGGTSTVAVDATVVPTYFKGSASLGFPGIPNGACAADQAISVPGAAPGDAVAPGWPALLPGLFGTMLVSGANTIDVRLCNLSGMTVYPAIATFSATIIRSF